MKWVFGAFAAVMFGPLIFTAMMVGLFAQSWAPFWFGQRVGPVVSVPIGDLPLAPILGPQPIITDGTRYQLALAAGFSPAEAETATALSIAENGGGDPAALSPLNRDGSRDLGLWQINSGWWPQFGGQQALIDPLNNARAAHAIYTRQGWCAWSTYEVRCGPGHTGSYRAYLNRARSAALA